MQQPAALGDPSRVEVQQGALSLKARETASLSLKRIFEQHLQMNTCNSAPAARSSSTSSLDHLQNDNDQSREQHATLDLDLDLRLAAPSSSATYTELIQHQFPHVQSVNQLGNAAAGNKRLISTTSQLTVCYAGSVYVFEDVPADKAKAIMLLAAGSAGDQSCLNAARKSRPATPASSSDIILSRPVKPLARPQAELPFARKQSLERFLERRKDRVETKAAEAEIKSRNCGDILEPPQKRLCTKPFSKTSSHMYQSQ